MRTNKLLNAVENGTVTGLNVDGNMETKLKSSVRSPPGVMRAESPWVAV